MTTTALRSAATEPVKHVPGSPGYRRATLSLFAAGMTTFMALYYVQGLLPQLSSHFQVSPTTSASTWVYRCCSAENSASARSINILRAFTLSVRTA